MISSSAAKVHAEKLLKYIEDISHTNPYSNTQRDLVDILGLCQDIMASTKEILDRCNVPVDPIVCDRSHESVCNGEECQEESTVNETNSASVRRYEISSFERILLDMLTKDLQVVEAKECAELLLLWYSKRFLNDSQKLSKFRYNIDQIKNWIHSIVLAYGQSIRDGTTAEFTEKFFAWCNELDDVTSSASKYPLPYLVYELHKNRKDSDMSAPALVIWDILYDVGLKRVNELNFQHIVFQRDDIKDLCEKVCPRVAYWHEDYRSRDDGFLLSCKLHRPNDRL